MAALWILARLTVAAIATAFMLPAARTTDNLASTAWIVLLALTVPLSAIGLERCLNRGAIPTKSHLWAGAALDVAWCLGGYWATGFNSLPFPAFMAALVAMHAAFLPMAGAAGSTVAFAIGAGALQILALRRAAGPPGEQANISFLVGLALIAGITGSRLKAVAWRVERLREAVREMSQGGVLVAADLPVGVLVLNEGQVESSFGKLGGRGRSQPARAVLEELKKDAAFTEALAGSGDGETRLDGSDTWIEWSVARRSVPDLSRLDVAMWAGGRREEGDMPRSEKTIVVLKDRSDWHKARTARATEEWAKGIAVMSAALAHELRNPVAALSTTAEQLSDWDEMEQGDRQILQDVLMRESGRLNRMLEDFLEYSRIDFGGGEKRPVGQSVAEAVALATKARPGARIRMEQEDGPTPVADGELVVRVVSNLVLNALDMSSMDEVTVKMKREDGNYFVAVEDNGPGVAEENADKIFLPFFTTRKGGTGVGLSISARAAALLGGRIDVNSQPRGATFTLVIPETR